MKSERTSGQDISCKAKKTRVAKPQAAIEHGSVSINAESSRDWMPVEELWKATQAAVSEGKDVLLNLDKLEYLDASALQILLALNAEQMNQGRQLQLVNASPNLRHWFEYSGAVALFPMTERKCNE